MSQLREFSALVEAEAPWGDCGLVLVHGMGDHLPRLEGRLQLERTAPYVPEVTLPALGSAVVTGEIRQRMLDAGLTGCSFVLVHKTRIVCLDWSSWDQARDLPPVLPEPGEPENYVLSRSHDPELAEAIGELWEVRGELVPDVEVYPWVTHHGRCRLEVPGDRASLPDVLAAPSSLHVFFSLRAQAVFTEEDMRWCRFEPEFIE